MKRHLNELVEKAKSHTVFARTDGSLEYIVRSGDSDVLYTVRAVDEVNFECSCEWAFHNPGSRCSHILAVVLSMR